MSAPKMVGAGYPVTPDGRYFVVRGRLWRTANPALSEDQRSALVSALMSARSRLRTSAAGSAARAAARQAIETAKVHLGERGPVWWMDGAPDYNRRMVKNSPYAGWYEALPIAEQL
ncbi:hypothetical protein [Roseateles noduli]|uniref:hypothetical protein n=1 Tax=Roseateles noduli TaxID=2052484 RepID=UPI003D660E80